MELRGWGLGFRMAFGSGFGSILGFLLARVYRVLIYTHTHTSYISIHITYIYIDMTCPSFYIVLIE